MIRSLIFAITSAIVAATPVSADHLSDGDHIQHGHHGHDCCFHIEGQTAEVLIAPRSDAVRRIQAELAVKGFDPGPIDGVLGPLTQSALRAFQRSEGLYEGLLTTETLSRLGIHVGDRRPHPDHQSSDLAGSRHAGHGTESVRQDQPATTTIVRREPSDSAGATRIVPKQIPNYIGRRGEHEVEALTWRDKAKR